MPKILRARRSGEPGKRTGSVEGFTGQRVSADRASKSGVRRLFARDPAKGAFVNFGTDKDILDFRNDPDVPNVNAAPSPTIINGSSAARQSVSKLKASASRVINRSVNRSLRRR